MKLIRPPYEMPANTALQETADAAELALSIVDTCRQELMMAKKHLISDKNRPKGDSWYFGAWNQKQRQTREAYRFKIELLQQALAELANANNDLAEAIESARLTARSLPWEPQLLADDIGYRVDPGFKALTLNLLMVDQLSCAISARLFAEHQDLKNLQSNSPDNFHKMWGLAWIEECLRYNMRNYTCRYLVNDSWLYLPSEYSDYLFGHGKHEIPDAPCMTMDEACSVAEKLVLESWNNWGSKDLEVEIYDITKGTGQKPLLSDATKEKLSVPPPWKNKESQAKKKKTFCG